MSMRCPTCGTIYGDDAKFCTKDGGRLMPYGAGAAPVAPADPRPTTPRLNPTPGAQRPVLNHANMAGQVLDGRYAIVKKVGEGGMSFVYLAHDVSTNERYAIKILSPALSKDENSIDRKSTRLNSSHIPLSRMPSSA